MQARIRTIAAAIMLAVGAAGCQTPQPKDTQYAAYTAEDRAAEQRKLNELLDVYFQEYLALNPVYATFVGVNDYDDRFSAPISDASVAQQKDFDLRYLEAINQINPALLSGQDLLSYEVFKYNQEINLTGYAFPTQYVPITQMGGAHNYFAMLGSGSSAQPFNTLEDYQQFQQRAQGFAAYMDSAIVAMRQGIAAKVVLPLPIVDKLMPQLNAHVVDNIEDSVFYMPIKALPEKSEIDASEHEALTAQYRRTISEVIIPAYRRMLDFVQGEYRSAARLSVGLSGLPEGKDWYEYQIAVNTTLPLSAEEIHEFGQQEVERILNEMKKVKETVGFEGDLQAFFTHLKESDEFYFDTPEALIQAYTDVKDKIDARVGLLFEVFPKAPYEVRAVEAYRAESAAGASYQSPAPDGSRPGIFYINAHNLKAQPKFLLETLSVHEAAPGHHFQIAIQQEVEGLPAFRKFGGYTVFAEGWALYAESLGKEMGLFTDPYMWYGRLADEQLRAMRLVVDTGLHAFGWSREQAIDFMRNNSSMAESDIVAEVERYISIPGQALSYKVGQRKIRLLREKATDMLGDKFDIKQFHTQVLTDGALPMPILEAKLDRWINEVKQQP